MGGLEEEAQQSRMREGGRKILADRAGEEYSIFAAVSTTRKHP
jgi:hypothetical protein